MKDIEKILNVDPIEVTVELKSDNQLPTVPQPSEVVAPPSNEPEDDDYEFIRSNYYDIIHKGNDALAEALEVARQSQHPRAFEVVAQMLKTLGDINRQVMQAAEDRQKVKIARKAGGGKGPTQQAVTNIDKAVFVGNSSDLNDMLVERKKINESST
jgi:hypothetical protein